MFDFVNTQIVKAQTAFHVATTPREEGQALVEYGLLVGLIAVGCVAAVKVLGTTVAGYFTSINTAL